jgi:Cysteine rich repeat
LRVEIAILRRACGPDVQVNCPGVRPGGGEVMACLAANEASLSPRCRRELAMAKHNM